MDALRGLDSHLSRAAHDPGEYAHPSPSPGPSMALAMTLAMTLALASNLALRSEP